MELETLRDKLWPPDPSYCAEPLDIDEARWLVLEIDRLRRMLALY